MNGTLKELSESLGVDRELCAYDVQQWAHCDEEKGITCSAEVHMDADKTELGAEVCVIKDQGENEEGSPEQVFILQAKPNGGTWNIVSLIVKGEDYLNKFTGWDEKACNFFRACIKVLNSEKIPDIDELIEEELSEDDMFGGRGGRRGRAGKKAPKVNPAALLGVKKGM